MLRIHGSGSGSESPMLCAHDALLILSPSALEPVAPFPKWTARLRFAGILVPLMVASLIVPVKMVVDGTMFLIGVLFFSQPILSKLTYKLTHRFPHWRKFLELRR